MIEIFSNSISDMKSVSKPALVLVSGAEDAAECGGETGQTASWLV